MRGMTVRKFAFAFSLALMAMFAASEARGGCRIAGVPSSIRERLIKQFNQGKRDCDFQLIVNARKLIKGYCGQWQRASAPCAQGTKAAVAAAKCISSARVDGVIAYALRDYDAAWKAYSQVSASIARSCDKKLGGSVDHKHLSCNAYNPRSAKSSWKSQVLSFCGGLQSTVKNFTLECDKKLPRPRGPNEYLMGHSGPVDSAINSAVSSAAKSAAACIKWGNKHLYAAAGEKGCEAKASIDHALRLCAAARIVKLNIPPKPKPKPKKLDSKVMTTCEKAFKHINKFKCGDIVDKYIIKPILKKLPSPILAVPARCYMGVQKGFGCGIFDAIFGTAETLCASIETCMRSKIGRWASVVNIIPGMAVNYIMGCYIATMVPRVQSAAKCISALTSSPALQKALAEQAMDFVCEFAGGLVMDVLIGALTGGASAGGSVASKVAKVASLLNKISKVTGTIDKLKMVTIFSEVNKINAACGQFGVKLPASAQEAAKSPSSPPMTIVRPDPDYRPPATTVPAPKCKRGYEVVKGKCRLGCKWGYVRNSGGWCVRKSKTGSSYSKSCKRGYQRIGSRCLKSCKRGYQRLGSRCLKSCKRGYVRKGTRCLRKSSRPPVATQPKTCMGTLVGNGINVREKTHNQSRWVGILWKNATFEILAENVKGQYGSWVKIKFKTKKGDKIGHLMSKFVKKGACK